MTMHDAPDAVLLATGKENTSLNVAEAARTDTEVVATVETTPRYKLRASSSAANHRRVAASPGVTLGRDRQRMASERESGIADFRKAAAVGAEEQPPPPKEAAEKNKDQDRRRKKKEPTPQPNVPDMIIECVLDDHGYVKTQMYHKGKFLGKGGFARCYEMTRERTGVTYAGKVVAKASLVKPAAKQKFTSEIKIHKSLRHPNVVQFEHFFDDAENSYILLELCRNQSLSDLLRRRKKLSEAEVRFYLRQLVDGVAYLHANLVIHRDLKLGNLFLTSDMQLKIGDFGLATRLDNANDRKRTMCGTPNYIAPEILSGSRGDGHSFEVDVWSIGVVVYTLLIGRPPFETDDVKDTYKRIRAIQYAFPDDSNVSPEAQSLIRGILQLDPRQRPSLDAILKHPFLTNEPIPSSLPRAALLVTPPVKSLTAREKPEGGESAPHRFTSSNPPRAPSSTRRYPLRGRDSNATPADGRYLQQRASDPGAFANARAATSSVRESDHAHLTNRRSLAASSTGSRTTRTSETASSAAEEKTSSPHDDRPRSAMESTYKTLSRLFLLQEDGDSDAKLREFSSATAILAAARKDKAIQPEADTFLDGLMPLPAPLWISQWVDYTSKYGIGYILSNGASGVYFNDSTKIISSADGQLFDYIERASAAASLDPASLPRSTRYTMEQYDSSLSKKVTLLGHFRGYLVDARAENSEVEALEKQLARATSPDEPMPIEDGSRSQPMVFVQKWVKTRHAVLFQLSNGSFQFNFFDKSKLVLSSGGRVVTFLDRDLQLSVFAASVAVLTQERPDLAKRLRYARDMLHQMVKP